MNWEAKIKQSNAPNCQPKQRKGSNRLGFFPLYITNSECCVWMFDCNSIAHCMSSHWICMRNGCDGLSLWCKAISVIAVLFGLFVHWAFFSLCAVWNGLNYADGIKDECYMALFDAQQGLFLRWCPQNMLTWILSSFPQYISPQFFLLRIATLFCTLFSFWLSRLYVCF